MLCNVGSVLCRDVLCAVCECIKASCFDMCVRLTVTFFWYIWGDISIVVAH